MRSCNVSECTQHTQYSHLRCWITTSACRPLPGPSTAQPRVNKLGPVDSPPSLGLVLSIPSSSSFVRASYKHTPATAIDSNPHPCTSTSTCRSSSWTTLCMRHEQLQSGGDGAMPSSSPCSTPGDGDSTQPFDAQQAVVSTSSCVPLPLPARAPPHARASHGDRRWRSDGERATRRSPEL